MLSSFPTLAVLTLSAPLVVHGLWPMPTSLMQDSTSSGSTVKLSHGFSITAPQSAPGDLRAAVQRSNQYIRRDKLAALTPTAGAEYSDDVKNAPSLRQLKLSLTGDEGASIAEEANKPFRERNEAYQLAVPADGGEATLTADTSLGLFRGLTTFEQMWYDLDGTTFTREAGLNITDAPAYPYRGFMLDTARNFFTVDDIKRTLDAMSWVKLSVFHWHIVDSQSFPLVLPGYEELSSNGAYFPHQIYSPQDIADIIKYAAERGITVLPEIDTPGHTSIISKSHPDLIACPEKTPWATYANEPPAGQLRIASEETVQFTNGIFSSLADLFQDVPAISTGGDEVNANCYAEDEETQAALSASGKTIEEALSDFVLSNQAVLSGKGKSTVVWQEMVLDHNISMPVNDTIVIAWISSSDAQSIAAKGYNLVHGPSDYFYLDCGHGGWVGNFPTGNSWCDPFKTWQKAYTFDPLANLTTPEERALVLGGQSLMWTEQTNVHSLDSTVWPRAASAAEVFWSAPNPTGENISAALPRLHSIAYRMNKRGVGAIALQPHWCAVRPGVCDLTA